MQSSPLIKFRGIMFLVPVFFIVAEANAQCPDKQSIWDSVITIQADTLLTKPQKLQKLYILKQVYEKCHQKPDSAYAKILLQTGIYEYYANKNYKAGIQYATTAIKINTQARQEGSKLQTANAYYTIAFFYKSLGISDKALLYYDSVLYQLKNFPDSTRLGIYSRYERVLMLFHNGDYRKMIDESIAGMRYASQKKDTAYYFAFLNQKAQALYFENRLDEAIIDVDIIIQQLSPAKKEDIFELASALKMKAMIQKKNRRFFESESLFKQAIKIRIGTNSNRQIALDYIDYGNFFLDSLHNYKAAEQKYREAIKYAQKIKDSSAIALALINTGEIYIDQKVYTTADNYTNKALAYLKITSSDYNTKTSTADKLMLANVKGLPVVIMNNKIEILLGLFKEKKTNEILDRCINNCLIMDTFVTKMRYLQSATESKLYWRNYTRNFYTNALEASYLAKRADLIYYFQEKSRAVLLNDKMKELGASAYLSGSDVAMQESYQMKIIDLQQELSETNPLSKKYQQLQFELITTRNEFEKFIKSLEQKYPAYYQYKYEDEVLTLAQLQSFLKKNNQSFAHYFTGDTVTYILGITPTQTKFIRLSQKEFDKEKLSQFLQFCASKQALNNNYNSFAELSNSIYASLFKPLQLPKGRVIVCMDNTVIPFEALCTDTKGKHFLLNHYSFDYAYSARFLMKEFQNPKAKGNFAGFAPVSFAKSLDVADLKNAATALNASASFYGRDKLFTHQNASRNNFFYYAPSYSVVSIFSHAYADTTDNEPVLFMQDSLIHLSELQKLNDPATRLVLLSACQTNIGKNATGEGIYSLARGFATAGIPSVAATLWKADEKTIYIISEKLNEYLAKGMNKDEALRKAKIDFIQNSSSEKIFPYYWANMILIGNADAIEFETNHSLNFLWWAGTAIAVIASTIMFFRKRKS